MKKYIKKFNESNDIGEDITDIRVKDIIKFLQKFDPEAKVILDKDGWECHGRCLTKDDVICGLFDDSSIRGGDYIIVNN